MLNQTEITLDRPFPGGDHPAADAVVQDRPTLGSLPGAQRGLAWWVIPLIDFLSSALALAVVTSLTDTSLFPALPLASFALVITYTVMGTYGTLSTRSARESRTAGSIVARVLATAFFVWIASLLGDIGTVDQLALFAL